MCKDGQGNNFINFESFSMALDKLNLNTKLIQLQDKHAIFDEFAKQNNKFPYKEFLDKIEQFNFDPEKIYADMRSESEPLETKNPQYESYL